MLLIGSILINSSRAAQFIGLLAIGALVVGPTQRVWRRTVIVNVVTVVATVVVVVAVGFALVQSSGDH